MPIVRSMAPGFIVWFTGLSGSGKSTLAARVTERLRKEGVHVECLDGDEVRKHLSYGLGFSREDRDRNVRRIGYVARMAARSGACAITAAISPYRSVRKEIRTQTDRFCEVYCECPLEVLAERDPKGLYKRAMAGEIKNFTGVDDPYEEPESPEVHLRTDRQDADECLEIILQKLRDMGFVAANGASKQLPPPYGGELAQARVGGLEEGATIDATIEVDQATAEACVAIGAGYLSPVTGPMSRRELERVRSGGFLERGLPWPRGLELIVDKKHGEKVRKGMVVALTVNDERVARLQVQEVWSVSVATLGVAGVIEAVDSKWALSHSARQVRKTVIDHDWSRIAVGFTRHAPNVELDQRVALLEQALDGIVLFVPHAHEAAWRERLSERRVHLAELPAFFAHDEGAVFWPIIASNLGGRLVELDAPGT